MNTPKPTGNRHSRSGMVDELWENARVKSNLALLKQHAPNLIRENDPLLGKFLSKTADPELALEQLARWQTSNLKSPEPIPLATTREKKDPGAGE